MKNHFTKLSIAFTILVVPLEVRAITAVDECVAMHNAAQIWCAQFEACDHAMWACRRDRCQAEWETANQRDRERRELMRQEQVACIPDKRGRQSAECLRLKKLREQKEAEWLDAVEIAELCERSEEVINACGYSPAPGDGPWINLYECLGTSERNLQFFIDLNPACFLDPEGNVRSPREVCLFRSWDQSPLPDNLVHTTYIK